MKKFTGFLLFICMVFIACPADDGGNGNGSVAGNINIVNATNLFIAPSSSGRSARNGGAGGIGINKLFKITEDGYVQEVSYYFYKGDEKITYNTDIYPPTAVYDANDDYVIVCFGIEDGYLTRKSDGAAFSLNNIGFPQDLRPYQEANYKNAKFVQNDAIGNIYFPYHVFNWRMIKINTSDPDKLTGVVWIECNYVSEYFRSFDVSSSGHIIYSQLLQYRIKKSNGGLINLPNVNAHWIGLDGNIKYYTASDGYKIWTVNIDANFQENRSSIDISFPFDGRGYLVRFNDRIISVNPDGWINEIENPSNTPRSVTRSEIHSIKNVVYSNDYYYLSGNNSSNQPVLLKVDPKTDAVITLLEPDKYDIYKMTVDNNNIVSFNAERMFDGVKVIGQVSSAGTVTILDETLNTEVVVLVKVN